MSNFAWVTLTTNDAYSLGALVLAHSLKRVQTAHQLAVLVTPTVSEAMRCRLREVYNVVKEVNVLDSQDAANLALLERPELGITFTKLHAWKLLQYEKCVFLDSDILVIQNADELFEREELSAAPDVSWPDCFNSGVFVYRPSEETFASLTAFGLKNGSFDGGDQGLLNLYYSDWAHKDISKHLPFTYNTIAFASYSYLPAFKQFRDKVKILHFAGKLKPWLLNFNSETKSPYMPSEFQHASDMVQLWWTIFCENVHKDLSAQMNYWPKMEFRSVTTWTENRHTSDSSSFNKTNYDSGHFFDDIQPYHDPWEDYYEKLEKLNEQNSSNNNETSSPHRTDTADQTDPNANKCSEFVPPPAAPTEDHHQQHVHHPPAPQHQRIEDVYNANVTQQSEPSFTENVITQDNTAKQQQTDTGHGRTDSTHNNPVPVPVPATADTHHTMQPKELNKALNEALLDGIGRENIGERDKSKSISNSVPKSNSNANHNSNTKASKNPEKIVVEQTQSKKKLSASEAGLAGALAQVRLGQPRSKEQEDYEALMRRQCWESGNIDFSGRDSFDNIWKKISQTLEAKPTKAPGKSDENLTSADIEDGKIEYDPVTKTKTQYKLIEGGYEVIQTIPQQNGTNKTQVKTFYDPKPVTEEELRKQQQEKKIRQSKRNKNEVVQVDKNTTMIIREIPGGYEEVYTTVYDDGSKSTRVKTFYDAVEVNDEDNEETTKKTTQQKKKTNKLNRTNTEEEENVNVTQKKTNKELVSTNQKNVRQVDDNEEYNMKHEQTVEETRRVTKKTEVSNKKTSVRTDSVQEENVKAVTSKDKKKKSKKAPPPPPADFEQNDTTTVVSKNVPGGVEYTYSTTLESGKTITTSKTIYEEEETELTEEEIQMYKKQLKDAEKHKNVTTTKKLKSESGTKKIVPSENPGDVTTVETIKIEGGTEYHYTTVTSEGIVKKAVKTVYDPTPVNNPDDTDEEEYVEEYEEEIIEPGEKIVKTIETTKTLPQKYEEVVEKKTPKKKSSKLTRTNTEEEETRIVQKKNNEMMAINQQQSNVRQVQQEEHHTGTYSVRRESKVEETRTMTQKVKISGGNY